MCRWLLSAADRAHTPDLAYTHALIARMLGTRRQTVTETVAHLQAAGLIRNSRVAVCTFSNAEKWNTGRATPIRT